MSHLGAVVPIFFSGFLSVLSKSNFEKEDQSDHRGKNTREYKLNAFWFCFWADFLD